MLSCKLSLFDPAQCVLTQQALLQQDQVGRVTKGGYAWKGFVAVLVSNEPDNYWDELALANVIIIAGHNTSMVSARIA